MTKAEIKEIYDAKKILIRLQANWIRAIKEKRLDQAEQIQQNRKSIIREIKEKYQIILE